MRVEVRDAYPPFGMKFAFESAEGGAYGFTINDVDTASFEMGRGDPALEMLSAMMPGRKRIGQFVTIPREDGLFTWAGWITNYKASPNATVYQFVASDPGYLLKSQRTAKMGTYTGSAGRVLQDILLEIQGRSVLPISLERITTTGPYMDFQPNAKDALAAVNEIARHANYEWWWDIEAKAGNVVIYLRFEERKGSDKRSSVRWNEGQQLNVGNYSQDADGLFQEVLVVGGTGIFAERTAVSVGGKTGDGATGVPIGEVVAFADGSPVFGGAQIITTRSINDQGALGRAGASYAETPEEYGEQLSGELVEANTDMSRWEVGDIITVHLDSTDMGLPVDLPVRIMGAAFKPDTNEHDVELLVRSDLI